MFNPIENLLADEIKSQFKINVDAYYSEFSIDSIERNDYFPFYVVNGEVLISNSKEELPFICYEYTLTSCSEGLPHDPSTKCQFIPCSYEDLCHKQ